MMNNFINSFNPAFNYNNSTYATCYEMPEIRQSIDNEWYRAAAIAAYSDQNNPPTIMEMYIEPLSDYFCPDPIRSYKVKLRIISKDKGLPVNYNEQNEDVL